MLNVIQRTLVLLGNANELVAQTRRCNIFQCVDKSLVKYVKDSASKNQESLFGQDFCSQLKNQVKSVKTFSQVASLAHRYHPYEKSRETTLGHSKSSFFGRALSANLGPSRATPTPKEAATPEPLSSAEELHPPGQIGKILNNIPPPNSALQALHLDMALLS